MDNNKKNYNWNFFCYICFYIFLIFYAINTILFLIIFAKDKGYGNLYEWLINNLRAISEKVENLA